MNSINIYDNKDLFTDHIISLLTQEGITVNLVTTEDAKKSDEIIFIFSDSINKEKLETMGLSHESSEVFYFHNVLNSILVGPLVLDKDDPCIFCSLSHMKQQGTENLITVCSDKKLPFALDENADKFLIDFFKAVIENPVYLNRYHGYYEHININLGDVKRFRLVKDEFCTYCGTLEEDNMDNFNGIFSKDKKVEPGKFRVKAEVETDSLFNDYYDTTTGVFSHAYREYLSSTIPAFGLEMKLGKNYTEAGFGRAYTRKKAEEISRLEAIERFCGCFNRKTESKIYGSYEEFKDIAIDPETLGLHSSEEWSHPAYKIKRYSKDIPIYWKWVYSIKNNKKVLIPEQSIYYGDNFFRKSGSNRFVYESSNGMALGTTFEEALLHGLFEVIERDNFLCEWYNRFQLQEIDINSTSLTELKEISFYLKQKGFYLRLFDISMELEIPTVWALLYNDNEDAGMKCYNAAGSNFNPEKAVECAALEVLTSLPIYDLQIKESKEMTDRVNMLISNPKAVTEFHDHVLYYSSSENAKVLDFALKTNNMKPINEVYKSFYEDNKYKNQYLSEDLEAILKEVLNHYDDVYIVDLTPSAVAKRDLSVAKVIVPGMLPIAFGQQYKRIVNKRLVDERIRRGLSLEFEINTNPHPFP